MNPTDTPVPFFIGFSGKKQTGKDTATRIAVELLKSAGKNVAITAFAEPLKEMCISIVGLDRSAVYGSDKQKNELSNVLWDNLPIDIRLKYSNKPFSGTWANGRPMPRTGFMTCREVLQVIGTDIFREFINDDIWAKAPFNRDWAGHDVVILTDCRFPNEKIVTEEHGGVIIRLERDTGFFDHHPSETALDNAIFDHIYVNNGSIEDLENFVKTKLEELELL